jgi:hypothetical protein
MILPKANLGLQLSDGENAILLREGGAMEIVYSIERLIASPDLAHRMGESGRRFAKTYFSWQEKTKGLEAFYASLSKAEPTRYEVSSSTGAPLVEQSELPSHAPHDARSLSSSPEHQPLT